MVLKERSVVIRFHKRKDYVFLVGTGLGIVGSLRRKSERVSSCSLTGTVRPGPPFPGEGNSP